jgi:glycosyltransferase involved in cell wall biosynthesis
VSASPTVGVVVAVRNGVDQLAAALEGVLSQEPAPTDVVVLDGGSTDGSADLAATVDGVRVVAQVGLGLGAARNQALREVRGELVAFCDSDDRWAPDSLTLRIEHLSSYADCDAVIGRVVTTSLDDEVVPDVHIQRLGVPLPGYTPGALLARRRVFDAVGPFNESMRIGTDSEWFVRLRQSGCRLDLLDDVVLFKGVRATSLSADVDTYRRELLTVARAYITRRRSGA